MSLLLLAEDYINRRPSAVKLLISSNREISLIYLQPQRLTTYSIQKWKCNEFVIRQVMVALSMHDLCAKFLLYIRVLGK